MDKDKYIDEIADILQETDDKIRKTTMYDCATYGDFASAIIDAGYCKADEVRKETATELYHKLFGSGFVTDYIKEVFAEYGFDIEVDE